MLRQARSPEGEFKVGKGFPEEMLKPMSSGSYKGRLPVEVTFGRLPWGRTRQGGQQRCGYNVPILDCGG